MTGGKAGGAGGTGEGVGWGGSVGSGVALGVDSFEGVEVRLIDCAVGVADWMDVGVIGSAS
jgi:hypothetical protein